MINLKADKLTGSVSDYYLLSVYHFIGGSMIIECWIWTFLVVVVDEESEPASSAGSPLIHDG